MSRRDENIRLYKKFVREDIKNEDCAIWDKIAFNQISINKIDTYIELYKFYEAGNTWKEVRRASKMGEISRDAYMLSSSYQDINDFNNL